MGLGSAYQAGLKVPNPFDAILDRKQKERESARTAGIRQYEAKTGRMRLGMEEGKTARATEEARLSREAKETIAARTAGIYQSSIESADVARRANVGINRFQAETSRMTAGSAAEERKSRAKTAKLTASQKTEKYEWDRAQRKDQAAYDSATAAIARGDYGPAERFMLEHAASIEGIDLKGTTNPFENALAVQKILGKIPKFTKTAEGVSVLYPGETTPQGYSKETFMGELWGPQNPKGRTQALKKDELSEAEKLAREKWDIEKQIKMTDYPGLITGAAEKIGAGYDGGPADSTVIDGLQQLIGQGAVVKKNPATGKDVIVMPDGRQIPMPGGPPPGPIPEQAGITPSPTQTGVAQPSDLEQIKAYQKQLGQYLDATPIELSRQPVNPRTGIKGTPNVSGIETDQGDPIFTAGDVADWGRAGIDRFGRGMDEATRRLQEAADKRRQQSYSF